MSHTSFKGLVKLPSGRTLYVEKHARDASASGPDIPFLVMHGMYLTSHSWAPALPLLSQYTRILYDAQGHGQTPPESSAMSLTTLVEDTRDVLAHFGYAKAYAVGHSAGAYAAVNFTQTFPEHVVKLILVTPCVMPMPGPYATWPPIVRTISKEDLLNNFYFNWMGKKGKADPEAKAYIRADTDTHDSRREHQARFHEVQLQQFEFKTLHGIEAYIIIGDEDSVTTPEQCLAMCEYIGAKSVHVREGHYQPVENPHQLAETMISIVKS